MDGFANLILNNAQTVRDGGMINSILKNVKLLNNSQLTKDIMPHITSPRLTGGYGAGIFFGIIWILSLISLMVYLLNLHFNKTNVKASQRHIFRFRISIKKGKINSFNKIDLIQILIIFIFLIPLILLLCFCFVNINQIYHSIDEEQKNPLNSTDQITSIIPSIKKSILHLRYYLSTFSEKARENTAPIVEDIIKATKNMQKETMTDFNGKLMRRLGVENTFKYGREMTNIVVSFFDVANYITGNQTMYNDIVSKMYPRKIDPPFGLFRFISEIKTSFALLPYCDAGCEELKTFFKQDFSEVEGFPDIKFATSFLFIMKQQNKTRESVIAQTEHGKKEMDKTMAKTQKKMKNLLDIDGTIRNMTGETWTKMDHQFQEVLKKMDNLTLMLNSKSMKDKQSVYSNLLIFGLVTPVLFGVIVLFLALAVLLWTFSHQCRPVHNGLKCGIYFSLVLLSLVILVSMLMFLYGGKVETELCRYLRTGQPVVSTDNGNRLVLDKHINDFLNKTLPKLASSMPKSEFPLPKPKNVLYGIIHRCRKNEAILSAIDAIDSLDTAALSKPEVAAKFIKVGRFLLLESLNETDPDKMLPPDMKASLAQASQLGMFKQIDIEGSINIIPKSPIFISTDNQPVSISVFVDRITKYISAYASKIKDPEVKIKLQNQSDSLMILFENYSVIRDRLVDIFRSINNIPPIQPVVDNLSKSLNGMVKLLKDKPTLLDIGNQYFDKYIVASTPKKAANIMAIYGPKMMSRLGHCRPLFEAYRLSIDSSCDNLVTKLNVYWVYLGSVGLLLTFFLSIVFLIMFRAQISHHGTQEKVNMTGENDHQNEPFVSKSGEGKSISLSGL